MPDPACEECGFLLVAHATGDLVPRCPECGTPFDPLKPWTPPPLPSRGEVMRILVLPLMVSLVVFVGLGAIPIVRNLLIWWALPIWFAVIGTLGFLWPIGWAFEIARERTPRSTRRAVALAWITPVLIVNTLATVAALIAYVALL